MATEKRQTQIPGTERASIPEIDEAAEEYRLVRDERMALSTKEAEAKKKLVATMQSHNQSAYRYDDQDGIERNVKLETKVSAKVAKVKGQSSGDTDDTDNVSVQ